MKAERCMRQLWFAGDRVFAGKGAKKRARRWVERQLEKSVLTEIEQRAIAKQIDIAERERLRISRTLASVSITSGRMLERYEEVRSCC